MTGLSWEVLYNAVNKSIARVQVRAARVVIETGVFSGLACPELMYELILSGTNVLQDAQDDLTVAQQNIAHFEAVEDPAKLELCQQDVAEKEGYLAEATSILKVGSF